MSSDAVNVDNRVLGAVSVEWDTNSSMGGREDVTMEEKWERRLRRKVTKGGEVGGRDTENWIKK